LIVRNSRLRVFESAVRCGGGGWVGEWRKLRNEELQHLYCSPDSLQVIKWRRLVGHVAQMEKRNTYRDWDRRPKGKRLLVTPNSRRQDNTKMYLREIGLQVVDMG
jgi:hypothetical protein